MSCRAPVRDTRSDRGYLAPWAHLALAAAVATTATLAMSATPAAAATPTVGTATASQQQQEGNSATAPITVTVVLSAPATSTVTVRYATADGTAKSGASDYTATSGTLSFAAGTTSRTITVAVRGDTTLEDYETFTVKLSSPSGATLGRTSTKVTILNDERPQVTVPGVVATEGSTATFAPALAQRYFQTITAGVATVNGTAGAPGDYTSVLTTTRFAAGSRTGSKVGVSTVADGAAEPGETFGLTVSAPELAAPVTATGTIAWHLASSSFPIRGAFYYGWYPGNWGGGTQYHPTLGQYSSGSPAVIAQHIAQMRQAKIKVAIASWWGPGHPTDQILQAELDGAAGTPFTWSAYYEQEGSGAPTSTKIGNDLATLWARAQHANWLHVNGRPVIFVYGGTESCATVTRWKNAPGSANWYVVQKVFSGFKSCANQPDDWHQYGPALATQVQLPHSYVISPGFYKYGEATPRLTRDPVRWRQNIRDMIASGARWQLITTFNEWIEGTSIEPATEFGTTYLDALATDGN